MKWDSLASKVSWWEGAGDGEVSLCRCQSLGKKVLGGQRGSSDGHNNSLCRLTGTQGAGKSEWWAGCCLQTKTLPFPGFLAKALYIRLAITLSGDKGLMGPPGPKGMLFLLLLRHH